MALAWGTYPDKVIVPVNEGATMHPDGHISFQFKNETYDAPYSFKVYKEEDFVTFGQKFTLTFILGSKLWTFAHVVNDEVYSNLLTYSSNPEEFIRKEIFNQFAHAVDAKFDWEHPMVRKVFLDRLAKAMDIPSGHKQTSAPDGTVAKPMNKPWGSGNYSPVANASHKLPAMKVVVDCPSKDCAHHMDSLRGMIMHLNDQAKWSREKIADWIDELHDAGKINAEFQPWDEDVDKTPKAKVQLNDGDGWKDVGYTTEGFKPTHLDDAAFDIIKTEMELSQIDYLTLFGGKDEAEEVTEELSDFEKVMKTKKNPNWSKFTNKDFKKGK